MAHNKMIRLVLLMAGLTLITTPATADEEQYARMPWHLVDLWWDIGDDTPLESYSVEVTISDDIPSTRNLYIAPIGLGHLSKTPFYGGIQTQAEYNRMVYRSLAVQEPDLYSHMFELGAYAIGEGQGDMRHIFWDTRGEPDEWTIRCSTFQRLGGQCRLSSKGRPRLGYGKRSVP